MCEDRDFRDREIGARALCRHYEVKQRELPTTVHGFTLWLGVGRRWLEWIVEFAGPRSFLPPVFAHMTPSRLLPWRQLLGPLAALLILKVTLSVVLGYREYVPANFRSDFLFGRESYFWGAYAWAFYAHIVAGPITLVLGLVLLSQRFRTRLPAWHRRLGRVQGMLVLVLLVPSGLWMAWYAQAEGAARAVAGAGFAALSMATGACVAMGWRSAVQRRFAVHRVWMMRGYLLLCSAVVLRVIGGLSLVTGVDGDWRYAATAWGSWVLPLGLFELRGVVTKRIARKAFRGEAQSTTTESGGSLPAIEMS
jgi:hypothetical protein